MSKFLSTKNLFKGIDFKKVDKIQRMYMHLLAPEEYELRDLEDKRLAHMKRAWHIMTDEFRSRNEARKLIIEMIPDVPVTLLIRDTENLFGRFEKINLDVQKSIYREKLTQLAQAAETAGEIEEARKCIEALMKLDGIDGKDDKNKMSTDLPMLELTTNPTALTENVSAEEISYEETTVH